MAVSIGPAFRLKEQLKKKKRETNNKRRSDVVFFMFIANFFKPHRNG